MILPSVLMAAALSGSPTATADHVDEVMEWRMARLSALTAPFGWLSLVGMHWLEPGSATVGRAEGMDMVLNAGPAQLGSLRLDDAGVTFEAHPLASVRDEQDQPVERVRMHSDADGESTVLRSGTMSFQLIDRGGPAIRVKDAGAPTRTGFAGINYFPIDSSRRVEARFEPHAEGHTIEIANVLGQVEQSPNPGALVFELDGQTRRLEAVAEGDQLFIIFGDRTNGKTSYGAGRFIYARWPENGVTTLDFNRAYNPPCVFTEYSTCPLPPQSNRLPVAIEVGEKDYIGAAD